MAKPKFRLYYERMIEQNQELFDSFRKIHDRYEQDQNALQEEFNQIGEKVMITVKDWEDKLCMQSEKGGYSSYTPKLAEKFQAEVKKSFPMYDHIGLIVQKPLPTDGFSLKKIKLF